MESNSGTQVEGGFFTNFDKNNSENDAEDSEEKTEEKADNELVEVLTAETPARFSLHRKGRYAVAIIKNGYVTQTHLIQDKLTAGEVVGTVVKTAGTVMRSALLGVFTGGIGLLALPAAGAVKGGNISSGKNKELSPNPLEVSLELTK
ncbi:MAG: hypothetical protein ACI9J2_002647 [Saprospiraceae bacterium]